METEWIKLTAEKLAYAVVDKVLKSHVEACPHGQAFLKRSWYMAGVYSACSVIGGVVGALLSTGILKHFIG